MGTDEPRRAPDTPSDIDLNQPHASRMYDYYLGGKNNYAIDRLAADKALQAVPSARVLARSNRTFLLRAVRRLAEEGITQFIDLGAGIPGPDPVHEQAHAVLGDRARVVYVDYEHVACAHGVVNIEQAGAQHYAAMVRSDFRAVTDVFNAPEVRRLIDLDQPVALLTVLLLHFLSDADDPAATMRDYGNHLAPGSRLVVSHLTYDGAPEATCEELRKAEGVYAATANPIFPRDRKAIAKLVEAGGWQLTEPGLVRPPQWRADPEDPSEQTVDAMLAVGVASR